MTRIINFTCGAYDVQFLCKARSTRNGFAHDAELHINGSFWEEDSCFYLNRTWESWNFQSACLAACSKRIRKRTEDLRVWFKEEHGLNRLAGKNAEKFAKIVESDWEIELMKEIKKALNERRF